MFAREVTIHLKPDSRTKFTQTIEKVIIPLLRSQRGFKDEIALVVSGGKKAVAISLWEQKENAETYDRVKYPEVLKAMAEVIEGIPQVETYEVSNSTWHKIAAPVAA
jgi:hypothetical protein